MASLGTFVNEDSLRFDVTWNEEGLRIDGSEPWDWSEKDSELLNWIFILDRKNGEAFFHALAPGKGEEDYDRVLTDFYGECVNDFIDRMEDFCKARRIQYAFLAGAV